ncbi:MAG TPA: hypothetical protein VFI79_17725 [Gemmatimonadales bacterium]|nr:hypothetical protein [Gemmatimonadales bacterium]
MPPSRLIPFMMLGILACGSDKAAGPAADLTGSWSGTETLSGSGLSCAISLTMQLTQTGATFNGTYSNGSVTCNGQSQTGITGTIINGTVSGSKVTFDVDDPGAHQTGTVAGNTMNGNAHWTISTSSGSVSLAGTWSATRP